MTKPEEPEVFAEFAVTYLTEVVTMDPRAKHPRQQGMVKYKVFAKNAEDALARLRAAAPIEHPIIEIAGVMATGDFSNQLVLPHEWGEIANNGGPGGPRLVKGH